MHMDPAICMWFHASDISENNLYMDLCLDHLPFFLWDSIFQRSKDNMKHNILWKTIPVQIHYNLNFIPTSDNSLRFAC